MPRARRFSVSELNLARAMRAAGHDWHAIGDRLCCEYTTIRQHIDPQFDARARNRRLVDQYRRRRHAGRQSPEVNA